MELKELQRNWDAFGETDPLWAILAASEKKGNRWDVGEFFRTGVEDIDRVMQYLESLRIPLRRRTALDFGCGVGRLTQALARHFDAVCGVDIAPSMIELARSMNRSGSRCRFILNEGSDLRLFDDGSFDFIVTMLVLQHMKPRYAKQYLREFVRLLVPGGVLVFQMPSEEVETPSLQRSVRRLIKPFVPKAWLKWHRRRMRYRRMTQHRRRPPTPRAAPRMEMYGIKCRVVERLVNDGGARIIDVLEDGLAGPAWVSRRYCVVKP
jgi:ubiquinone/menaquinone biosynthesis C-methylase UbiE